MQQPDLFTGDDLRDFGIQAAERDRTLIIQAVDKALEVCAAGDDPFTAEDVRAYLGRYVRDHEDISKVIGGRIRAAAVADLIETDGATVQARRPEAHARRMLLWRRKAEQLRVIA
jgi:hypothetical protein